MKEAKPHVYCFMCLEAGKYIIAKVNWYDGLKLCIMCLKKV